MSLDKTLSDNYREPMMLEQYPVSAVLPDYFETVYPKFVEFMNTYYLSHGDSDNPASMLNELQHNRNLESVTPELLSLIGNELLMGGDYSNSVFDKRSAIQLSNLLYRSKGTSFSIQEFFRLFFGIDSEVRYGRNEIFMVGDPLEEDLSYISEKRTLYTKADGEEVQVDWPGSRLKFNFDDGVIQVWVLALTPKIEIFPAPYILNINNVNYIDESGAVKADGTVDPFELYVVRTKRVVTYNAYYQLRENIDYVVDYLDKSVKFLAPGIGYLKPGWKFGDPWLDYLSTFGELSPPTQDIDKEGVRFGPLLNPKARINVLRQFPAGSHIGPESTNKKITDNGYYQLFSLLIRTPVSIKTWRALYKDFIHPAGMYLAGETSVVSVANINIAAQSDTADFDKNVEDVAEILSTSSSEIEELNIKLEEN